MLKLLYVESSRVESIRSIRSFCLSYEKSIVSCKARPPQSPLVLPLSILNIISLSIFLKFIGYLPTSSSSSSRHFHPPVYLSFYNVF